MSDRPPLLVELKRRNVLRGAVLYIGAMWALAQGISQLTPAIGLPNAATRWFLIAALIGFPFWLVFSWLYELTPQGLKRDSEVAADAPSRHSAARKLNVAIISVLAVAVVLLASGYVVRFIHHRDIRGTFTPPADSIVVLPFANLGGDKSQQYFSDGITEELTDALGQNSALRVIAWDTASKFRGDQQAATVGKQLNVANLLHGSILREGDAVRITAELVDTRSGYQVWSHHYDSSFKDIFAVQDQVSEAIANALQVQFAKTDLPAGGTSNPEAHELVLKGRALADRIDATPLEAARKDFEQAIALDPDYADAHAELSDTLLRLTERSDLQLKDVLPQARAEAEKALVLDPRNADAWDALGLADLDASPPQFSKATLEYRKALAFNPSDADAHIGYGLALPLKPSGVEFQKAARLDPDDSRAQLNLAWYYQDVGDWAKMQIAVEAFIRLDPSSVDGAFMLAFARQQLHQHGRMVQAFDLVKPATPLDQQQVDAGRLVYQSVADPALRPQALAALNDLSRKQTDTHVMNNLVSLYAALGERDALLQLLENLCPAEPTVCDDLSVDPWYAALHGDPRFAALVKEYDVVSRPASSASIGTPQPQ